MKNCSCVLMHKLQIETCWKHLTRGNFFAQHSSSAILRFNTALMKFFTFFSFRAASCNTKKFSGKPRSIGLNATRIEKLHALVSHSSRAHKYIQQVTSRKITFFCWHIEAFFIMHVIRSVI